MDSKAEQSDRHYEFLSHQRDAYLKNLTQIGAELIQLNDGEYDVDTFVKQFVPSRDKVKNKVTKRFFDSQTLFVSPEQTEMKPVEDPENSIDSQLMNAIQAEFKKYKKDFRESLKISGSSNSDIASIAEVEKSQEIPTKGRNPKEKKKNTSENVVVDNDLLINQIINNGELCKIFVQKSRVDFVRSKSNKPRNCFEDDNLETIYIYRSGNAE